jgi:hypothetical protein
MQSTTSHHRNEPCSAPAPVATARQRSRRHGPGRVGRSQSRPRRWMLVQVWDGAVLAAFDDEVSARAVMSCADDDEVVVLCVGT